MRVTGLPVLETDRTFPKTAAVLTGPINLKALTLLACVRGASRMWIVSATLAWLEKTEEFPSHCEDWD
jgi:hypothetical protein